MADETYILIFTPLPTHNDTGIIIANAINKIFTMTEIMTRSQILRRHTTYDKGKAVHIHSWHRQVAISIKNNINIILSRTVKGDKDLGIVDMISSSSMFKRSKRIDDH